MKRLIAIITLFIILVVGGIIWWENGLLPANPKDTTRNIFVIEKGSGLKEIANKLETQGFIKNRIVFFLYTRFGKFEGKIQAGDFRLSPSMDVKEIAENLTHGTLDIWVTIPEGKRSDEIADILQEKIPSFKPSWRIALRANEGYLFPDTYLIPKDAIIDQIINIMRNNFYAKIQSVNLPSNDPRITKITIMASLIEREALRDDEKPIIASVITNRLDAGMSLDIDATLQYIKGKSSGQWWSVPTIEDKKINSEYNTYINVGLPPAPIANPGLEAIKAALNPQKTNYYYYIHDPKGNVHFAKTLEEHNANIRKYGL